MGTSRRFGAGLTFVLIGLLLLSIRGIPLAFAQDGEQTLVTTEPQAAPLVPAPVADTVPPMIAQPPDLFAAAADAWGASVAFGVPYASDETDGPVNVVCSWESGAIFSLGTSTVTCSASDLAQNQSAVSFLVTVADQSPPVIAFPADVFANAVDPARTVVNYAVPIATDNVDGGIGVGCDWGSGAFFAVGTTIVTCQASDSAGNEAAPVAFSVVVSPPPPLPPTQEPTIVPTATQPLVPTEEPTEAVVPTATTIPRMVATVEPTVVVSVVITETQEATPTLKPNPSPTFTPTITPDGSPTSEPSPPVTPSPTATLSPMPSPTSVPVEPVPAALELPWPPPGNFVINTYGGSIETLEAIWGYQQFPISQEFGHTGFSIAHFAWYAYGVAYGLDGFEHTGLDIGMPAGTWLYSPVDGTVSVSGGTPYYTYYGNGDPHVGELRIMTDDGNEVILGHMGRISVDAGERVEIGQFVGLSGGDNGDHLHLEVREVQFGGWHRIVDPRTSFVVDVLKEAAMEVPEERDVEDANAPAIQDPVYDAEPRAMPPRDVPPRSATRKSGSVPHAAHLRS